MDQLYWTGKRPLYYICETTLEEVGNELRGTIWPSEEKTQYRVHVGIVRVRANATGQVYVEEKVLGKTQGENESIGTHGRRNQNHEYSNKRGSKIGTQRSRRTRV